jgi:hypothetical protein
MLNSPAMAAVILRDRRNLVGTTVALKPLDVILADITADFGFD